MLGRLICFYLRNSREETGSDSESNYIRSGLEPPNRTRTRLKKSVRIEISSARSYNVGLEGGPRFGGGFWNAHYMAIDAISYHIIN